MSDVSRYLPLSQRPRTDETGVTGDWSDRAATALAALADRLEALPAEGWAASSGRPGWTVAEIVGALEWRLTLSPRVRARAVTRTALARRTGARTSAEILGRERGAAAATELVAALRAAAAAPPRRLRDLALVVVATLDVDRSAPVDPLALGAVALARSLSAPLPIRAVIRSLSLQAFDAGWSVGRGEVVRAPGAAIVLFLYGRTGVPANTMDAGGHDPATGEPGRQQHG
jgi:hypothetical protein